MTWSKRLVRPIQPPCNASSIFRAQRALEWDRPSPELRVSRLRHAVLHRLGDRRNAATTEESLAVEDAQRLIAREEGFERWEDLISDVER